MLLPDVHMEHVLPARAPVPSEGGRAELLCSHCQRRVLLYELGRLCPLLSR